MQSILGWPPNRDKKIHANCASRCATGLKAAGVIELIHPEMLTPNRLPKKPEKRLLRAITIFDISSKELDLSS
jgi:hypothetical protein